MNFPCIFGYLSMIFSVIPYDTLILLKYCILKRVGFKIQPEQFLNFFLIFGEKFSLVSYKLVSYIKKTCSATWKRTAPLLRALETLIIHVNNLSTPAGNVVVDGDG